MNQKARAAQDARVIAGTYGNVPVYDVRHDRSSAERAERVYNKSLGSKFIKTNKNKNV